MAIIREELKVGETYMSDHNDKVLKKVLYIGKELLFCLESNSGSTKEKSYVINRFIANYSKPPTPKKRFWIWDIRSGNGSVYKATYYLDDDGYYSDGKTRYCNLGEMFKKHENEFIDIEVE